MNQGSGDWFLLSTHAHVLLCVAGHPNATAREIAEAVGITERHTRRVLADLHAEHYLEKVRNGSRNRYSVRRDAPFKHPLQAGVEIRTLIDALERALAAGA